MTPDLVNGIFEAAGAGFMLLNIRSVMRHRSAAGADWRAVAFFGAWGLWNLFFYPHLGQWASFAGGCALVAANAVYVALLLRYSAGRL